MNYSPASLSPGQLVVVGILTAIVAFWLSRKTYGLTRFALFSIALVFAVPSTLLAVGQNPWLVDARFRTFKMFYWGLHPGMTRADVVTSVNQSYPLGDSIRTQIQATESPEGITFSMTPKVSGEKRESFLVRIESGMVIGKKYLSESR